MGGLMTFLEATDMFWNEGAGELCEVGNVLEIMGNFENIEHWLIL